MNKHKILIFKDKKDFKISISNDKVINITGMTGSGKSTLGKELSISTEYELLNFDWIFGYGYDKDKISTQIKQIIKELKTQYPEINEKDFFRWKENKKENEIIKQRYKKYVKQFYLYIINKIQSGIIIEGIQLLDYLDVKYLKGELIVKRTSLFNCYTRAFKRDVYECYKSCKKGEMAVNILINKIIERIKIPIHYYKKINNYIFTILNIYNTI